LFNVARAAAAQENFRVSTPRTSRASRGSAGDRSAAVGANTEKLISAAVPRAAYSRYSRRAPSLSCRTATRSGFDQVRAFTVSAADSAADESL